MSQDKIDNRIIEVGFEIDGQIERFRDLYITANGTKFANENQNECEIVIANLDKATRDYLVTATSPFNKSASPKKFFLSAGRESTGISQIYTGDISSVEVSQPPDIKVKWKTLTGNDKKTKVTTVTHGASSTLSEISKQTSENLGLKLNFQASDKNIANYSYSGGSLDQVGDIGDMGSVDAFVDDDTLIVKDSTRAVSSEEIILSEETGLVGVPELTEQGIKVTYFLDNKTKLGGLIKLTSILNPALNGEYIIYKLGFNVATREVPFYWIAEAKRR